MLRKWLILSSKEDRVSMMLEMKEVLLRTVVDFVKADKVNKGP